MIQQSRSCPPVLVTYNEPPQEISRQSSAKEKFILVVAEVLDEMEYVLESSNTLPIDEKVEIASILMTIFVEKIQEKKST